MSLISCSLSATIKVLIYELGPAYFLVDLASNISGYTSCMHPSFSFDMIVFAVCMDFFRQVFIRETMLLWLQTL